MFPQTIEYEIRFEPVKRSCVEASIPIRYASDSLRLSRLGAFVLP